MFSDLPVSSRVIIDKNNKLYQDNILNLREKDEQANFTPNRWAEEVELRWDQVYYQQILSAQSVFFTGEPISTFLLDRMILKPI